MALQRNSLRWKHALILGEEAKAASLRQVIGLIIPETWMRSRNELCTSQSSAFPDAKSGITVLVSSGGKHEAALLQLGIEEIRLQTRWPGPILAIANPTESEILRRSIFFSDQDPSCSAHFCLEFPVSLKELLEALSSLDDFSMSAWMRAYARWKAQGSIAEAQIAWEALRAESPHDPDFSARCLAVVRILTREGFRLLLGHDAPKVESLKKTLECLESDKLELRAVPQRQSDLATLCAAMTQLPRRH
jgi:hypothetical protein